MKWLIVLVILVCLGILGTTGFNYLTHSHEEIDTTQAYASQIKGCLDDYQVCSSKLARWEVSGLTQEALAIDALEHCYLIVTNGTKPSFEDYTINDIRTLDINKQAINGLGGDYDTRGLDWNYWLACRKVY